MSSFEAHFTISWPLEVFNDITKSSAPARIGTEKLSNTQKCRIPKYERVNEMLGATVLYYQVLMQIAKIEMQVEMQKSNF